VISLLFNRFDEITGRAHFWAVYLAVENWGDDDVEQIARWLL
jgi:hypothetical protein